MVATRKQLTRALALLALSGASAASAATLTWDGGGSPDVLWSTGTNWSTDTPPAHNDDLIFPSTAGLPNTTTHDLVISGDRLRIRTLTLNSNATQGWTINTSPASSSVDVVALGSSTDCIIASGAALNTINGNVRLVSNTGGNPLATTAARISVAPSSSLRINGSLSSSRPITLTGGGTLRVSGNFTANASGTNDDTLVLNSGTFWFEGSTFSTGSGTKGIAMGVDTTFIWNSATNLNTGTPRFVMRTAGGDRNFVFSSDFNKTLATGTSAENNFVFASGTGVASGAMGFSVMGGVEREVRFSDSAATTVLWDTDANVVNGTFRSGAIKLNTHTLSDAKLKWTNGINITRNGTLRTIDVGNVASVPVDAEISGVISSSSGTTATTLRKSGAGTLLLSGANTYADALEVAQGKLLVSNTNAFTTVTVNSGATLGGTGRFTNAVGGAGTISPGNSAGILAIGSLNASAGTDFAFDLTQEGAPNWAAPAASGNDVLRVLSGGLGTLDANNVISVTFASTPADNSVYQGGFFTVGDHLSSLADATFSYSGLGSGQWVVVSTQQVTGAAFAAISGGSGDGYVTVFTVVPEPGSLALLAAGSWLMVSARRRSARL
jgi:fibronectin-binding autotransporter adhesin